MSEAALHLAFFAVGLAWTLPAYRSTGIHFACAAAYPLGLVLWVGIGLAMILAPSSYSAAAGATGLLAVAGAGYARSLRTLRDPDAEARVWLPVATWAAGFAAVAVFFDLVNLALLTTDSFAYIGTGRSLSVFGDLGPLSSELTNMGAFQIVVQSAAPLVGVQYLHAAAPLLATSGGACFIVLGVRVFAATDADNANAGHRVTRTTVLLLAAAAMASPYFMLAQAVAIHSNYGAAVFLLLFCATFWLRELEGKDAWTPLAFAFLLAFALHRIELPVFAAAFALIACSETRWTGRRLQRWLTTVAVVIAVWYGLLSTLASEDTRLLRPPLALVVAVGWAALPFVTRFLESPRARSLRPWVARAAIALPIGGLVIAAVFVPERMSRAGAGMLQHWIHPAWGMTWLALPLLTLAALRTRPFPMQRLFSHGLTAAFLGILLTGSARAGGFHGGLTDSGNRMLVHVVPALYFFVAVSLGRARS